MFINYLGLGGCTENEESDNEDDLWGYIEDINDTAILIDSESQIKGLIWISINEDTVFLDDVDSEFDIGNLVRIKSTGEIRESYPMQADAELVIENKKS